MADALFMFRFLLVTGAYVAIIVLITVVGSIRRWSFSQSFLPALIPTLIWVPIVMLWILRFPGWWAVIADFIVAVVGFMQVTALSSVRKHSGFGAGRDNRRRGGGE